MPLWTPSNLASPRAFRWYDASAPGTVVNIAGKVSEWRDISGNAAQLFQTGPDSIKPTTGTTTQNSRNVIAFDGSDWMRSGNGIASGVSGFSAWVIFKSSNYSLAVSPVIAIVDASVDGSRLQYRAQGGVVDVGGRRRTFPSDAFQAAPSTPKTANAVTILGGVFDYANATLIGYTDGTALPRVGAFQTAGSTPNDAGAMTLGGTQAASPIGLLPNGSWVAEILVLHRTVTTLEANQIDGYLAHKWGVATLLPSDHPYKHSAPLVSGSSPINGQSLIRPASSAQQQLLIQGAMS
jgi:hypothetical protein